MIEEPNRDERQSEGEGEGEERIDATSDDKETYKTVTKKTMECQ